MINWHIIHTSRRDYKRPMYIGTRYHKDDFFSSFLSQSTTVRIYPRIYRASKEARQFKVIKK